MNNEDLFEWLVQRLELLVSEDSILVDPNLSSSYMDYESLLRKLKLRGSEWISNERLTFLDSFGPMLSHDQLRDHFLLPSQGHSDHLDIISTINHLKERDSNSSNLDSRNTRYLRMLHLAKTTDYFSLSSIAEREPKLYRKYVSSLSHATQEEKSLISEVKLSDVLFEVMDKKLEKLEGVGSSSSIIGDIEKFSKSIAFGQLDNEQSENSNDCIELLDDELEDSEIREQFIERMKERFLINCDGDVEINEDQDLLQKMKDVDKEEEYFGEGLSFKNHSSRKRTLTDERDFDVASLDY